VPIIIINRRNTTRRQTKSKASKIQLGIEVPIGRNKIDNTPRVNKPNKSIIRAARMVEKLDAKLIFSRSLSINDLMNSPTLNGIIVLTINPTDVAQKVFDNFIGFFTDESRIPHLQARIR